MAPGEWRGLGLRVASAIVLGPPVLVFLYLGPPSSDILIVGLGAAAAWEWARLGGRGAVDGAGGLAIAAVVAALAIGAIEDRTTPERIETVLLPALREEAARLSDSLSAFRNTNGTGKDVSNGETQA